LVHHFRIAYPFHSVILRLMGIRNCNCCPWLVLGSILLLWLVNNHPSSANYYTL
jgi:hypothetical protein